MPRKRKAKIKGVTDEPDYFSECTVCGIECEGYQDNPFIKGICQCGHKKEEHSWPEGTKEAEELAAVKAEQEKKDAKALKKKQKREEMGLDSSARQLFAEHYFRSSAPHCTARLGGSFLLSALRFLDRTAIRPTRTTATTRPARRRKASTRTTRSTTSS